jgi:hypothetical protein
MIASASMLRALVAAALLLLPLRARAEIESADVRAGMAAAARLEYQRAATLLEGALRESLTREEKVAVYRTLGTCYVALDRPDEAREQFTHLLTINPALDLDQRVSPRVRAVFEEARAQVAQHGRELPAAYRVPELAPTLEPPRPREGQELALTLDYPGGLGRRAQLLVRRRGGLDFARSEAPVDAAGRARLTVPGALVVPPALEYYAVVLDDGGAAIARAGSLAAPLTIDVRARAVPLKRRAWFWGVIGGAGALVLAGVIATSVVLTSPATVTINPR